MHSFTRYLYTQEIADITTSYRRSNIDDDAILADFFNGDIQQHHIPKDEHYQFGLQFTIDAFRPPQLCRPTHIFDVQYHYPFKWTSNAEAPFSTDPYFLSLKDDPGSANSFGILKPIVFSFTRRWHHEIKHSLIPAGPNATLSSRYIFPMLLHTKTAIVAVDEPDKMRTIWGVPKPWIIAQVMFHWSYLAWIKRNRGSTPMLWGYETLTGGWFRLNHELNDTFLRRSYLMIDWKRFDKYALFAAIADLYQGRRSYLDFSRGYIPTVDYPNTEQEWTPHKAECLERLWNWTIENFFRSPIILPDGRMYQRQHAGIPSGLYTTQLDDSQYNTLMLATILHSLGIQFDIIKVQGDDSIIRLLLLIPPNQHDELNEALQQKASYYFGSIISTEKSKIANWLNHCEVLSYTNHNGLPHRGHIALLAQWYHTKAKRPTPETTMAQAIGFAYASLGFHKRTYQLCRNVYDFYKHQGYTPDPAGLAAAIGDPEVLAQLKIEIDHFPSIPEIQRDLLSTDYWNEERYNEFYPRSHFLSDF